MSYYFLHQEKRIAAPIAYVALILITFGLIVLMYRVQIPTTSRASKKTNVAKLYISNITAQGATVVLTTSEKVAVRIQYHETTNPSSSMVAFDSREAKNSESRYEHYIPLAGLKPQTSYTISPLVNGAKQQSKHFSTFSPQDIGQAQQPLFGKVLKKNLQPLSDVLVTVSFPSINKDLMFSGLSDESGSWIINVPIIKNKNGMVSVIQPNDQALLHFERDKTESKVTSPHSLTAPLRSIVLGKNYEMGEDEGVLGVADTNKLNKTLQILSPSQNAIIPSRYITVRGLAKPESIVTVRIIPGDLIYTDKADENGSWSVQNSTPLIAGTYSVIGQSSTEDTMTQVRFVVAKDGETVLGEATASPTTILTPVIPTVTPTTAPSPTTIPQNITPTPSIPQSGTSTNLIIIAASSLSLLGLVLLLY